MAFQIGHGSGENGDSYQDLAEINIIPLVDIMLVLLIIFMVAAPLSLSGIALNLPTSPVTSVSIDEKRVILSITKDGRFYIDKIQIQSTHLQEQFKSIFETKSQRDLYIRADKSVLYGKVIDAMSAAKLAGVQKISMLTTTPEVPL
jgi:biopolymer transport protein TolR